MVSIYSSGQAYPFQGKSAQWTTWIQGSDSEQPVNWLPLKTEGDILKALFYANGVVRVCFHGWRMDKPEQYDELGNPKGQMRECYRDFAIRHITAIEFD